MDFTNARDKRMRVDYEYDQPPTIEQWQMLVDNLINEQYITPAGDYIVAKINSIIINTEVGWQSKKFEVTVYMNVDLAGRVESNANNI